MTTQHDKLHALAGRILNDWGHVFADPDEDVQGSDAVDSLGQYIELAQDALAAKEPTPRAPSYKDLVAVLGSAVAEWAYLFPEKCDDDQHDAQSRKNLRRAERIYRQALVAIKKGR